MWVPAWHEQLGHVRLMRTTAAEREERKKLDKREKKERDEEEERNRTACNFVKYSLGLRHQVNFYLNNVILDLYFRHLKNITCRYGNKKAKNIESMDNGVGYGILPPGDLKSTIVM